MAATKTRRTIGQRLLDGIERAGNRLPDPATLFFYGILIVLALSVAMSEMGVKAWHPGKNAEIGVTNLLSAESLKNIFVNMPKTFTDFPPLGLVLMMVLGVGVAERSGLIGAALGGLVRAVPKRLLSLAVVFAGVNASIAADAGYVVLLPLAAAVYAGAGRHPLAGLAAAFAGVAGGFSANLVITPLDPLLAGLTQAAAQIIDPARTVAVTSNYFLMMALVPLFSIIGAWVTDRIVEPRLNASPLKLAEMAEPPAQDADARRREKRGLRYAGFMFLLMLVGAGFLVAPEGAVLRGEDGSIEPFLKALVAILFIMFLVCGIAYGRGAGTIKKDTDTVRMMTASIADMAGYIVLAFVVAQFLGLFNQSNLGAILAINGADVLKNAGYTGLPLLLSFVVLSMLINILIASASAKWAILAPIFVPMLMLLGISPEATQAAFRIGDSATNPITPLMVYFPLILIMARRYVPEFGIGSLVATMMPYAVWFSIFSTALLGLWFWLDIPYWPGIGSRM